MYVCVWENKVKQEKLRMSFQSEGLIDPKSALISFLDNQPITAFKRLCHS